MADILVLNGPNLNLLGRREPEIYGTTTLEQIEQSLTEQARQSGFSLRCEQSNAEHVLIELVHSIFASQTQAVLINPGAFTHTSLALRDALLAVGKPFYEVHISNVHQREAFRARSYLSDVAAGVVCGLGVAGYQFMMAALLARLQSPVEMKREI